jgi:hypothetical protein
MSKTDIEKYGSVESRQKTLGSHFASKVAGPKVPFVRRKEKGVKIQVKTFVQYFLWFNDIKFGYAKKRRRKEKEGY